ncbi:MAG TPA: hypothetical protein VMJ10_35515 [Kofleriaceae bacterium]|nr:hypothetical protein [Kofleriaceae bacterium]
MRNLLLASGLTLIACSSGPAQLPDPPVLQVTSPQRSLIQNGAGSIDVTGTATPGDDGAAIKSVMVNNVAAQVNADGSFSATIQVEEGATLIHTVATDDKGGVMTDTRSVEAGTLQQPGHSIPSALTAALSPQAFAAISNVASTIMTQENFTQLLAPMQPMVSKGGSCLGGQVYVDSLTLSNAKIGLVPVDGGLSFSVEIDGLDTEGHVTFDVACIGGSDTYSITADAVMVSGTLDVAPNGTMGFTTTLQNPNVSFTNLNISASGLPGDILDLIDLTGAMSYIVSKGAEMFMGPMMNQALGALAGPKSVMLAGQTITFQVSPSNLTFSATEADVALDTSIVISGAASSKGFVSTDNGTPAMSAGQGLELGIAANLANDLMSQFSAIGLLNITQAAPGGTFDSMQLTPTSAPMISADASNGQMNVFLPDMTATFLLQGNVVAKAALNVEIGAQIAPVNNGYGVAVTLGTPTIYLDVLPDVPNQTELTNEDLQKAIQLCLTSQIASLTALLGSIPLPSMFGLTLRNVSVASDQGYVMVKATLQ